MKPSVLRKTALAALTGLCLLMPAAPASATLLIMPVRAIFTDRDRMANITLVNTGDKDAVFRMTWRFQRQNETGGYDIMQNPLDPVHDISKMIVFSPRQVVLPPGGKQRVRLSLRRPPDLPDGEYRAHIVFKRMGSEDAQVIHGKMNGTQGKVDLAMSMNVGYSLPVMVRKGAYDTTVKIADPRFEPGSADGRQKPKLNVTLNRGGKFGSIGRLVAYWTPPGQVERQIGVLNNCNVFTDVSKRAAGINLDVPQVKGGSVRVVYEGEGPDNGITFDEKIFPVGG